MQSDSGCRNCLSIVASVLGIIVAIITIIKFFFPDVGSFYLFFEELWVGTFLGEIWPDIGNSIGDFEGGIKEFSESSPFHRWWTALLAFVLGGIVKYSIESWVFDYEFNVFEIPILAIPALVWIYVFYGTVSILGLIAFVVGYIFISIIIGVLLFDYL